jgi:uncharacterized repeat protein (TIGR01451 family)
MQSFLKHFKAIGKQPKSKAELLAFRELFAVAKSSLLTLTQITLQAGLLLSGIEAAPAQTAIPDLTINKSHAGSFSVGGIGVYTITVTNVGSAPSSGIITVTDTLPAGLSVNNGAAGPVVVTGTNSDDWFCISDSNTPQKITCTSFSAVDNQAGSNTSSFNLSVQIKGTAPIGTNSITNTVAVSGGGETNTTNNTASDPTSISTAPALTCPTMYGGARNTSTGAYNQIRIYSSTGVPGAIIHTMPTSETRAAGITPFLDSNGRRRLYYVTLAPSSRLRYFDGVNDVDTGITIPTTANNVVRLAVDSSGIVHIMDGSPNLWRYNPTTNTLSSSIIIADNPSNVETLASSFGGDIAFDATGVMYIVAFDSSTTATTTKFRLFRVDGLSAGSPVATLLATNPTTLQTGAIAYDPSGLLLMMTGGATADVFSWNLANGTVSTLPSASPGVFDLASCNFPNFLPVVNATKIAAKVAGSAGSNVLPGDTIEYTIVVRNTGSIIAAGVKFSDAIPAGTAYVPNSTTLNGLAVADISGAMRYATPNLINSPGKVGGSLLVDTTPATLTDNEAVIKFQVKVNSTNTPASISNQGTVLYTGGPVSGIKTDDPTTPAPLDSTNTTITPINQPPDTTPVSGSSQANPGSAATVQVPNLAGTDPEDGTLGATGSFKIVTLPSNGVLYYNGTPITSPNFVITNYDPTKLRLDPNDGAITVSFTYAAIDSAGLEDPSPATVTLPFTAPVACIPPAGSGSYATTGLNKNSIWWLNWECYNDTIARTPAGQPFNFTLPDGSTLTTTVKRTGSDPVMVLRAPSWGGAAIGNGQYNGITGKPIFYSVNFASSALSWQESLTNITVTDKAGNPRNYTFVTADGESTDLQSGGYAERLTFRTNGTPWSLVELVPQSGSVAPTSSSSLAGIGTTTTTWTGPRTNNNGSVILSTNSPLEVSIASTPQGSSAGGKQGAFFGLGLPKITLIKKINGRIAAADQFTVQIAYTAPTVDLATATSTGAATTVSTGATSVLPGNVITLSEVMATGSTTPLAAYSASIACTNANPTSTLLPSGSGKSFTVTPQIGDDISCTLTNEPTKSNLLLVKRITSINGGTTAMNGDNLALYKDDPTNPYDDNTLATPTPTPLDTDKWSNPSTFLLGGINGGNTRPGDELEYTIYFLSAGSTSAQNVLLCDRVPSNVSFLPTAFNTFANKATGGLTNSDRGIQWLYNGTQQSLTNTGDADMAQYFPPNVDPALVYPKINCGGANTNGAIVVRLGDLPNATAPGTPINSYGFIRFRGRVK